MPRANRSSSIDPNEITIVHTVAKSARNLFLLGFDSLTKVDNSHRKDWILEIMEFQCSLMAIDLLGFALMSNHIHQILRTRPDVVQKWDNQEVTRRWLTLCPKYRKRHRVGDKVYFVPIPPKQSQIDALANDEKRLAKVRVQLSSVSWWMRLLCQRIAQRANHEDGGGMGPLWKGRFHSTTIEDQAYLLGCSLYVDLNAVAAAISESIEDYDYTSAKIRLEMLLARQCSSEAQSPQEEVAQTPEAPEETPESPQKIVHRKAETTQLPKITKGQFLSEIKLTTMSDDPELHTQGFRCSDKGFLDYSVEEYLDVLEWCIKNKITESNKELPREVPMIFGQHPIGAELVTKQAREFDDMYRYRAGSKTPPQAESDSPKSPPASA